MHIPQEEDLALALLMMITNNIGQVAYLNAKLHGCTKVSHVYLPFIHKCVRGYCLLYTVVIRLNIS